MLRRISKLYNYSCEQGNYYYAFWSDSILEVLYLQRGMNNRAIIVYSYDNKHEIS